MQWIAHFGVGHENGGHSGRYPWGSGDRPKQDLEKVDHTLNRFKKLSKKKSNLSKEEKEQEKARKRESARLALGGGVAAKTKLLYMQDKYGVNKNTKATSSSKSSSSTKPISNNPKGTLFERFDRAKKKYPNLTIDDIYEEMNANMNIDDNDYYKEIEDKWLKKHGF